MRRVLWPNYRRALSQAERCNDRLLLARANRCTSTGMVFAEAAAWLAVFSPMVTVGGSVLILDGLLPLPMLLLEVAASFLPPTVAGLLATSYHREAAEWHNQLLKRRIAELKDWRGRTP